MSEKLTSEINLEISIEKISEMQKQILLKTRLNANLANKIEKKENHFRKIEKSLQEKLQTINTEIQWIKKNKQWEYKSVSKRNK